MHSVSVQYSGENTRDGARHIIETLQAQSFVPSLLVVGASCGHDLAYLQAELGGVFTCDIHGATSCLGIMTDKGHTVGDGGGIGVFAIADTDGDYATAARQLGDAPFDAAKRATEAALAQADRQGEIPEIVWVASSPGHEEAVLKGIQDVIGTDVPILGGSAADDTVEGNWAVFDRETLVQDGVVVSVIFPSNHTADAFKNGYAPTQHSGEITRSTGRRIFEIDNRPAAEVINEWTNGEVIPASVDAPVAILSESTLWPLGRVIETEPGRSDYILIHPSGVNPDGSIDVFADVEDGTRIFQMTGTTDALIARAGSVSELTRTALERDGSVLAGALVIFCGGCMLAVQDRVDEVAKEVNNALGGAPFLGVFTFGEQGRMQTGGNLHGNLMISCLAFGE